MELWVEEEEVDQVWEEDMDQVWEEEVDMVWEDQLFKLEVATNDNLFSVSNFNFCVIVINW